MRYIQEEKDAVRTKITQEELSAWWWKFVFQQSPNETCQYVKFIRYPESGGDNVHGLLIMESGYPPMRYRIGEEKSSGANVVYIEDFQPHVISRTKDWRWSIGNMYVSMESVALDEIPEDRRNVETFIRLNFTEAFVRS
eukprot:CAMPEP_0185256824 /NCGR_PEP_ID=MMETSP1359-20130426/5898_1 /TAXON_ID=552665 /ORGANISM="Bigelowiella longifila, Strain CCMP242" /LENGTH=138 /DNA_ID=CAMNT_0027841591 /DNA_START=309 /DNA_END=725 /DNA_ORIENTATION=+